MPRIRIADEDATIQMEPEEYAETVFPESQPALVQPETTPMKRVLLMDDEEMLRTLGIQMLDRLGYQCETVADGDAAVSAYEKAMASGRPFDVVMLDLTIKGGMGGVEAIKVLRRIDPHVRAIVCSGYCVDPVLEKFTDYGFCGALPKPYQKVDLERVLEKAVG